MIKEGFGYYETQNKRAGVEKKAVAGKLSFDEIVDKLKLIGFGETKSKELAERWTKEAKSKKDSEDSLKKWREEQDRKYGKEETNTKPRKRDFADSFVDAWNKKGLGVKAVRED